MFKYSITYHLGPESDDITITIFAHDYDEAVAFAKEYRKDAFSVSGATCESILD